MAEKPGLQQLRLKKELSDSLQEDRVLEIPATDVVGSLIPEKHYSLKDHLVYVRGRDNGVYVVEVQKRL